MNTNKAPDKIYTDNRGVYAELPIFSQAGANVQYIRKDALLEWLKIAVECYSHPDTENVVDTIRCEGKKWAFQDVINKIESL